MKKLLVGGVLALFLLVAVWATVTPRRPPAPEPVEVVDTDRDSEFIKAITEADVDKVRAMVKARPAYATERVAGKLAIVDAVNRFRGGGKEESRLEVLRCLLEAGSDPNAKEKTGETILCYAVFHSGQDDRLPLLLLEHGADPRITVENPFGSGGSALHTALWNGRGALAEALVAKGADVNQVNAGQRPLAVAEQQCPQVVGFLRSKGAQ